MRWIRIFLWGGCLLMASACMESSGRQADIKTKWLQEMEHRLHYLVKDSTLYDYVELNRQGLTIYASPEDRLAGRPEFRLYASEYDIFRRLCARLYPEELLGLYQRKKNQKWDDEFYDSLGAEPQALPGSSPDEDKPMAGFKVALDPGHMAADFGLAEWEGKYVKLQATAQTGGKEIQLLEPNLTLATAFLLKDQLEEAGAQVMMTRSQAGMGAMGISYEDWRKDQLASGIREALRLEIINESQATHLRSEGTEKEIFNWVFNQLDLRARAKAINSFKPDITLIIHFNVDVANWEKRDEEGFLPPGQANYNMAFVPGSYMKGELAQQEDRLSFVRLLLDDSWEKSLLLSTEVIQNFTQKLQIQPIGTGNKLRYLERAAILTEKEGVYARNLTLTRMVNGPLCYGESLCQDQAAEAVILSRKDLWVQGIPTSRRVKDVADAYFGAIKGYHRKRR